MESNVKYIPYLPGEAVFLAVEDGLVIGKFDSPDEAARFVRKRRKGKVCFTTAQYIYIEIMEEEHNGKQS